MPHELNVENLTAFRAPHVHMKNVAQVARTINKIVQGGNEKLQPFDFPLHQGDIGKKYKSYRTLCLIATRYIEHGRYAEISVQVLERGLKSHTDCFGHNTCDLALFTNFSLIVTDFDLTLTKQHVNGKQVLSSFGIFGKCKQLSASYTQESKRLYHKYRPIEIDPNISLESKVQAMEEWTAAAREMLAGFEFDAKELDEVAQQYGTALRDGTKHLFERLNIVNVPILVFSAGLGDVVQAVLQHNRVLFENVKIVSNFLKYKDGKLDGFISERLIHVFNKNEHAVEQEYFNILKGRCNVIVMGDSIGDAAMADGVKDIDSTLKIGFLYDHAEERLPAYMDAFDIVLVDDQTMNVPYEILKPIL